MPIHNYSVLKGTPISGALAFNNAWKSPHYRLQVEAGGKTYQADVNVQSSDGSDVLYAITEPFNPPVEATALQEVAVGFTRLDSVPGTLALDYVRERSGGSFLVDESDLAPLPAPTPKGDSENSPVLQFLESAWKTDGSTVYIFGSMYADSNGTKGIHDIHMNQGNPEGDFDSENGTWQDGALFLQSASGQWSALFIAFQTESWMTDDQGNPINSKRTATASQTQS